MDNNSLQTGDTVIFKQFLSDNFLYIAKWGKSSDDCLTINIISGVVYRYYVRIQGNSYYRFPPEVYGKLERMYNLHRVAHQDEKKFSKTVIDYIHELFRTYYNGYAYEGFLKELLRLK